MRKSSTLLIVDDDVDDRELFIEAAQQVNATIKCFTATNGEDALKLLKEENAFLPDYIFVDLNMPRLSGRQLLKELKQNRKLAHIPIIIYTTSRSAENKEECLRLGAIDFITKPNDFEDICKMISRVVSPKEVSK